MRIALASAALAALLTCTAFPVVAQSPRVCVPLASILAAQLGTQWGEYLSAAGVDAAGGLVQVYSNPESGTWTIAVTLANGPTCIVSSGEGWAAETVEAPLPGRPS